MPTIDINIPSQFPNLTVAEINTLISGSNLSTQSMYILTDATASDQIIAVMATSNNTLSTLAWNLTTNEFGNYSGDVFTPLSTGGGGAIIDVTAVAFLAMEVANTIDKAKLYRVTTATPQPCIVFGHSVNSSSALAFLEGESDGTGITALGGTGTYDLATGTFAYGFVYDSVRSIIHNGVDPSLNTLGVGSNTINFVQTSGNTVGDASNTINFEQGATSNIIGDNCNTINLDQTSSANNTGDGSAIINFAQNSNLNSVGDNSNTIIFDQNSIGNNVGNSSSVVNFEQNSSSNNIGDASNTINFEQNSTGNTVGDASIAITFRQNASNFVFGNNFQNCTIWPNLNGNNAADSGPIDFITGVTFLYGRTSPWEIRDIDRTAELLFLYVTYGDGSDPEEGWYDPATDVFTPSGGGVQSVTGDGVDNTDPLNPVLTYPTPADIGAYADSNPSNFVDAAGALSAALAGLKVSRTLNSVGNNTTFQSSTTYYFAPDKFMGTPYTNQLSSACKFVRAATMKGFTFFWRTTQGSATTVLTIQKGASISSMADTAATVTVPANAAAGSVTYSSDLVIDAGDFVTIKVVQGATGNSGIAALWYCQIEESLI